MNYDAGRHTSSNADFDAHVATGPSQGEEAVEMYDRLWLDEWRDMEVFNATARHLQRHINASVKRLQGVHTLLDVGCGIGINIRELRSSFPGMKFVGTDLSPNIMRLAREFVGDDPNIAFKVLDIAKEALPERYDVVLCNQVLEHIEDDAAAARNLAAMASRYLIVTVPGGRYNSTSKLVGHHRHYSKAQVVDLISSTGFEIVTAWEWGFPFHSVYKTLLGLFPAETQRKMGFGRYGVTKKMVTSALYLLYYANVWDAGANVFVVAKRPEVSA